MREAARVLDSDQSCPRLDLVDGEGDARAVAWPGVGSELRSMHRIRLAPGAATVGLRHEMEAVYYVMAGDGSVGDPGAGDAQPLTKGSMVHVEPGTAYRFRSGPSGMELIGGPCPPDPAIYRQYMARD